MLLLRQTQHRFAVRISSNRLFLEKLFFLCNIRFFSSHRRHIRDINGSIFCTAISRFFNEVRLCYLVIFIDLFLGILKTSFKLSAQYRLFFRIGLCCKVSADYKRIGIIYFHIKISKKSIFMSCFTGTTS